MDKRLYAALSDYAKAPRGSTARCAADARLIRLADDVVPAVWDATVRAWHKANPHTTNPWCKWHEMLFVPVQWVW